MLYLWSVVRFAFVLLLLELDFGSCRSLWNANKPEIVLPSFFIDSDESLSNEVQIFRSGPQARTVLETTYWDDGIVPYKFDKSYLPEDTAIILEGMKEIEDLSCVKFIPCETGKKPCLMIRNLKTCASHIGKIGDRQGLSLSVHCLDKPTVLHELMHTLGFVHEHSRPDRNEHIEVIPDNVIEEYRRNFDKYEASEINSMGEKYDINSIMHYDAYAYAIDEDKPTIVSLKPDLVVGSQGKLTESDVWKLNTLYNCNSKK